MTLVREVMTAPAVTLKASTNLCEATALMSKNGISGAPVVDDNGRLIGILCESDILEFAASKEGMGLEMRTLSFLGNPYDQIFRDEAVCRRYRRVGETKVEDAMNEEVVTIGPDDPISKALETMVRLEFNRLPVVENGKLVGMIARQDVLVALCREMGDRASPECATVLR